MATLFVSAGEPSGDLMAAAALEALAAVTDEDVEPFGLGGPRARRAGLRVIVDAERLSAMGVSAVVRRGPLLLHALWALNNAIERRRPKAALLVGFSEFNARLGRRLRASGTEVLWYAPPQVWAWRRRRVFSLRSAATHFAVTLPFEEALWASVGADARFVGHPAVERSLSARVVSNRSARSALPRPEAPTEGDREPEGVPTPSEPDPPRIALLPGSRDSEIQHIWPILLRALPRLDLRRPARLVIAEGLHPRTTRWIRQSAEASGVEVASAPAAEALPGCDVALVTSGTATLDCVAAGVVPVIVYRTDPVTYALARRLVQSPWIGLPNIVLGEPVFPELVQDGLTVDTVADAVEATVAQLGVLRARAREVASRLGGPPPGPSALVANQLRSWLEASTRS